MELDPQSLVNVELRDEVLVRDVSRIANDKINIIVDWRVDEERNELLREGIETRGRARDWAPWLELRRRTQDTDIWMRGRWTYMIIVITKVVLCFRCGRANWSVRFDGFLNLGGRRHGPTPSEKETRMGP